MEKNRLVHLGIIGIFLSLYFLVATISMINSVAFFDLAHSGLMNWALAIGFELGAAASLAAIIILDKTNRTMVWGLFILLTSFQMMANSFHAFINLENYMGWIELFGLEEAEPIYQKRVLSIVSGAILPLVALGFIKSLVDYIRPDEPESISQPTAYVSDETPEIEEEDIPEEAKKWKGAFDIETPVAGSAEPRIHPQDPYDIDNDEYFYFVHSNYVQPLNNTYSYTLTQYEGFNFCSSIIKDNLFACQFHPEKSGIEGIQILNNIFNNENRKI